MIHKLQQILLSLLELLAVRFIKPSAIVEATCISGLAFSDRSIQKDNEDLVCGSAVRSLMAQQGLLDDRDKLAFYRSVRRFMETATKYIVDKMPLQEPLLKHAEVVD